MILIVAELVEREQTVEVEQSATFELTVANGGPLWLSLRSWLKGLIQAGYRSSSAKVFLSESARATGRITIVPPRIYTTTAGMHHLAFAIQSKIIRGHVTRLGASLEIIPLL